MLTVATPGSAFTKIPTLAKGVNMSVLLLTQTKEHLPSGHNSAAPIMASQLAILMFMTKATVPSLIVTAKES